MLKRGKKFEESVEEKALKWKRYFDEKRHIYALILGPFFDVQRLLGRAPFYRDENGNEILILIIQARNHGGQNPPWQKNRTIFQVCVVQYIEKFFPPFSVV